MNFAPKAPENNAGPRSGLGKKESNAFPISCGCSDYHEVHALGHPDLAATWTPIQNY